MNTPDKTGIITGIITGITKIINKSKNKKKTNRKNKNRKNKKKNNVKNYYYIGINEKYRLYIIKKIDSEHIDQITLSTWKLINIWNDVSYEYDKISEICSDLQINISKDKEDYILIDKGKNNNEFILFKEILQLMQMNYVNLSQLKIIEMEPLYKLFSKESKINTTANIISVINEYLVSNLDIYIEIMSYRGNMPKQIIRHVFENYTIYKINNIHIKSNKSCDEYITTINNTIVQADDVFYESCKEGLDFGMPEFKHRVGQYSTRGDILRNEEYDIKDLLTDVDLNKRYAPMSHILDIDNQHDYKNCMQQCPTSCKFKKIIIRNLNYILHCIFYGYNMADGTYIINIDRFDVGSMDFNFNFNHEYTHIRDRYTVNTEDSKFLGYNAGYNSEDDIEYNIYRKHSSDEKYTKDKYAVCRDRCKGYNSDGDDKYNNNGYVPYYNRDEISDGQDDGEDGYYNEEDGYYGEKDNDGENHKKY